MSLYEKATERIDRLDILDLGLTKLGVAAVILMLVTFWPKIASLQWYWYLILAVSLVARPIIRFFGN